MRRILTGILCLTLLMLSLSCALAESETQAYGDWLVGNYVDDFGDPTGETYIYTVSTGTFSNTATSGSDLTVGIYYQPDAFKIRLLEYNNTKAIYYSSS